MMKWLNWFVHRCFILLALYGVAELLLRINPYMRAFGIRYLIDPERSSDPGHISAANVSAWVGLGLVLFTVGLAISMFESFTRWYFRE